MRRGESCDSRRIYGSKWNCDIRRSRFVGGPFRIIKRGGELESYSLFEQLILFQNAESLEKYVEGQLLPRIWTQGKTRCVLSMPDAHRIIALFYDSNATAAENYRFALKLDAELRETSFADTPHGAADCADVQRGNAPL